MADFDFCFLLFWYAYNQKTTAELDAPRQCLDFNQTDFWYSSSFGVTCPSYLERSTFDKRILRLIRSRLAVPCGAYLLKFYTIKQWLTWLNKDVGCLSATCLHGSSRCSHQGSWVCIRCTFPTGVVFGPGEVPAQENSEFLCILGTILRRMTGNRPAPYAWQIRKCYVSDPVWLGLLYTMLQSLLLWELNWPTIDCTATLHTFILCVWKQTWTLNTTEVMRVI